MKNNRISVEVLVNADIKKVWEYWTGAEHVTGWNHAGDDWHCPQATNDLIKGGKFNYTMASRDGKMSFDFEGIYSEVQEEKKIEYSMADGRTVAITFEDLGTHTKIVEVFDPENENPPELQQAGWQAILNNFKKYAENRA